MKHVIDFLLLSTAFALGIVGVYATGYLVAYLLYLVPPVAIGIYLYKTMKGKNDENKY